MRALAFVLALSFAAPALAAPKADATAELRKKAEDAFKAKKYQAALDGYLEASKRTHDPALLYNIARCYQELGNFADAHAYYTRFAVEAPVDLRSKVPHLDEKIAYTASQTAILKITANVAGVSITVNGSRVEAGPVRVNAGRVTIVGTMAGYAPVEQVVEVAGGATMPVRLELVSVNQLATLKVSANVTATVTIDDAERGRAPIVVSLPGGAHKIVATADGYEPWRRTVTLSPGTTVHHDAVLTPQSSTWWIWAGAAVIVVSGTAITYALLSERKADSGSYDPGQVAAGLVRF